MATEQFSGQTSTPLAYGNGALYGEDKELTEQVLDVIQDVGEAVNDFFRRQPVLSSILAAAVVGAVIGLVFAAQAPKRRQTPLQRAKHLLHWPTYRRGPSLPGLPRYQAPLKRKPRYIADLIPPILLRNPHVIEFAFRSASRALGRWGR